MNKTLEYLTKYPRDDNKIEAMQFAFGYTETEEICKKALEENKRIRIWTDDNMLDWLDYELI